MLTQEQLKEELRYDPETGLFHWLRMAKGRRWSLEAGTVNNHDQVLIMIKFQRYLAHRLAWLYVYGGEVPSELDHINGIRSDNRIVNLRAVTHSQNLANAKTRWDNTSGQKGVCWDKQKSKWKVQLGPAGK